MFKCLKQEDLNKEGLNKVSRYHVSRFVRMYQEVSGCNRIGRIENKESKAVLSVLYRIYKSFALVIFHISDFEQNLEKGH